MTGELLQSSLLLTSCLRRYVHSALWTSFLPTKIASIRFSLVTEDIFKGDGNISVESHLTSFEPASTTATATITADVSIFDESNEMKIQVENLTVSALSHTKPEEDYELYLHTVLDLDPECEIVTSNHYKSISPDFSLPAGCDLVEQRSARIDQYTERLETPPASPTKSEMLHEILFEASYGDKDATLPPGHLTRALQYLPGVDSPRSMNEMPHEPSAHMLHFPIQETQYLLGFQRHLGRVIRQIAHRYPRMNVFELTDLKFSLTQHILNGFQSAYLSYTIGSTTEGNLHDRLPHLQGNEKVSFRQVNLDLMETGDVQSPEIYDMIILLVSACGETLASQISTLKAVRKLIKTGGFLVMVDLPRASLDRQTTLSAMPENNMQHLATPPVTPLDLPEWLAATEHCGFVSTAINADQHHPLGFSLSVRQAATGVRSEALDPRAWRQVSEHLLLIGGQTEQTRQVSTDVMRSLLVHGCNKISTVDSLSDVTAEIAAACTATVFLTDLEAPVCTSMTARHLQALNLLMRPSMVALWVTSDARTDPERAASLGLTRTLKAEIPGLTLQVLDLDGWDRCASRIAEAFCQLASCAANSLCLDTSGTRLWSDEPEIHIIDGKRFIPRVLPYKPAIERLNAYRRPISATLNTVETCVSLKPTMVAETSIQYQAEDVGDVKSHYIECSTLSLMSVEYSTSYPVFVDALKMYICIGRTENEPELPRIALSSELASVVQVHNLLAHDLTALDLDLPRFAFAVAQALCANNILAKTTTKNLVLIEPGQILLRCMRRSLSEAAVEDKVSLQLWKCEGKAHQDPQALFRHPWSTARELTEYLPDDCAVHDFLPAGAQLSKTLATLGDRVHHHRGFGIQAAESPVPISDLAPSEGLRNCWKQAIRHASEEMTRHPTLQETPSCITPSRLMAAPLPALGFPIIDWNADRELQISVKPVKNPRMLDSNRTYLLVGLTRDLGYSLCRLFVSHGARHIVVASRNPDASPAWVAELNRAGASIHVERLDVTSLHEVRGLRSKLAGRGLPGVGGVINGAMVLDDRVFAQMDTETWTRVLRPKTAGSRNLDVVFGADDDDDLHFFIMTSSFAAVGGHAGQSNYAAANMFMNGLAAERRRRGVAGSVLNIGVIYGLGLLARERRSDVYGGLERDGYPPISERDLHHMFVEAIEAGRPAPGQVADLTTGLSRYRVGDPNPLHWHRDRRFCHFTIRDDAQESRVQNDGDQKVSIQERVRLAPSAEAAAEILEVAMCRKMESILQLPINSITPDSRISDIGLDSLAAVEMRNWFYKSVGADVPVMKILAASCLSDGKQALSPSHISVANHDCCQCVMMLLRVVCLGSQRLLLSRWDGCARGREPDWDEASRITRWEPPSLAFEVRLKAESSVEPRKQRLQKTFVKLWGDRRHEAEVTGALAGAGASVHGCEQGGRRGAGGRVRRE